MKIYERIKQNFLEKNYYISFSDNYIYIMNYKTINRFNDREINIGFNNFNIVVNGINFNIKRKTKIELEITGIFSKMEFKSEI